MTQTSAGTTPENDLAFNGDFGANEWLVEELYQQYQRDPGSVDESWQDFFSDYRPTKAASRTVPAAPAATAQPTAAPAAPSAAPASGSAPVATKGASPAPVTYSGPAPAPTSITQALRGASARVVSNMQASLHVPTATSVRAVPAKLLEDNRIVINSHLRRSRGGKVSFTHLIGYALVKAVAAQPVMNHSFAEVDGKPTLVTPEHVGLGLAIDLVKPNGDRSLVVAAIRDADTLDFAGFWAAYEDIVRRARNNKLTADDFSGVTISLTNPGGIGTVHSVPRLMEGQGTIVGVGSMEYPAEFQGASAETLARLAVSKVLTLTSTYDHRVIQGAQSGEFLRRMHQLLLGADGFYDDIFEALRIPYEPVRWVPDVLPTHEGDLDKAARVNELIHAYRVRGHLMADTDPLEYRRRSHPDLDIVNHGLTLWDLDRYFAVSGFAGKQTMKLRDVLGVLRDSYVRTVGIEYMHIQDPDERRWLQDRVERPAERPDPEGQLHVLERINAAEAFENFLQTKYVGQKRFSLEGGESVIPLLDEVLRTAAERKLDEVVIAMAHRGRLNVLANIVGKSSAQIFREFEGNIDPGTAHGSGDVKYHLGAEGRFKSPTGEIAVSLCSNPSHLEAVDPVLEGVVRAKQDILNKGADGFTVLPVMLHGDAAFAGQGVVAETLNMSQLRGYRTGGTIHVVINNQVGFTTGPASARSSTYSTDVARMVQAPIFHVNGDDPEACVRVARLAFEFRQAFHKDVVVDMVCYRRRGHNEADEPSFTQPLMYKIIDNKRSVRKLYTEALVGRGDITLEQAEDALKNYRAKLEEVFVETREQDKASQDGGWSNSAPEPQAQPTVATGISLETVKQIVDSQVALPAGFTPHPRLKANVLDKRPTMVANDAVDWAMGETLAIGSLLLEGHPVRLAGQDSRRGTFGQRHATLVDYETGAEYTPLASLSEDQANFYVYDSFLSEFAAVGFEYGYSVVRDNALVAWEAQFGDFTNGAQSILDEFISSGEAKWGQRSAVTLLLPHGYEGQGPDHSSARPERYLQMCAEDNMTVAMPSTPSSYFHLLRWQAMSGIRRPLIVMTPKSLLRLRAATSPTAEFTEGAWRPVLGDPGYDGQPVDGSQVRRVLLCSGKVYYDLLAARTKRDRRDVALVRLEQLYPVPQAEVAAALAGFPDDAELVWVQEEPANMGAWSHLALTLELPGGRTMRRVSRKASAAPSVGSHHAHEVEQAALVDEAFA